MSRIVCQFSCGAASAVATKLALAQHAGLHDVHILNAFLLEEHEDNRRFAGECESWFGRPITTLHFVDPPYMHGTRVMRSNGGYRHEMSDEDHAELLEVLLDLQGMVIVSGYDSELYAGMLGDWRREETDSRIAASLGTKVRREIVWINPACDAALQRLPGGLWAA